jgi:hypothetical protein
MSFHFNTSLLQLLERVSLPLHERFGAPLPAPDDKHEMLWACYCSGQMDDAGLEREIASDPAFADFVNRRNPPRL